MISALLIAAALAVLFGDQLKPWLATLQERLAKLPRQKVIAAAIAVAGVAAMYWQSPQVDDGRPRPVPGSVGDLDLRGLFTGPTAADDAAAMAALCDELAAAVEYDGSLDKPRLNTGWQIADLRATARDVRLKGQTFGDRQPMVREAVKAYLDRPEVLGKNGGPLGPKDRSRWVSAFRDIARAAEAAIQ